MISTISQVPSMPAASTREQNSQITPNAAAQSATAEVAPVQAAANDNALITQSAAVNTGSQAPVGGSSALSAAVDYLNNKIQTLNRNLEFSIDQQSGDVLVKVVDASTHELIRQIPSEEALALARNIQRYMLDHHLGLVKTKA